SAETRSGPGSTLAATVALRAQLPAVWQALGIATLVDAGCGDIHWLQPISTALDLYLGFDLVEEIIQRNRILFGHRLNHFFHQADICRQTLPKADAVLCRHCLTHLPNALVSQTLDHFRRSGTRYLIATTHLNGTNRDIAPGSWRSINLTAPPFSLAEPLLLLPDGAPESTCHLGVWLLRK
ncbi:MAG: class I SAM-dependent methyltransferase, partial [Magnetococcales bacterium]|nr:class I SAM-dependent methyltransferase [Magnetococcales bacterium]